MNPGIDSAISILAAAAGVFLFAYAIEASYTSEWLFAALLAAASLAPLTLSGKHTTDDRAWRVPATLLVAANVAGGVAMLRWYAPYNAVLLYGAVVLSTSYLSWLAGGCGRRRFVVIAVIANLTLTSSMLLATPQFNGIGLKFGYLKTPTTVGLFSHEHQEISLRGLSRVPLNPSRGRMVDVDLHVPHGSREIGVVRWHAKLARPVELRLVSVDLLSFVGFEGKSLRKLNAEALQGIDAESGGQPVAVRAHDGFVEIAPAGEQLWVDVPIPLDHDALHELPARDRNTLNAILHWQFGFFVFLLFAPGRRLS